MAAGDKQSSRRSGAPGLIGARRYVTDDITNSYSWRARAQHTSVLRGDGPTRVRRRHERQRGSLPESPDSVIGGMGSSKMLAPRLRALGALGFGVEPTVAKGAPPSRSTKGHTPCNSAVNGVSNSPET